MSRPILRRRRTESLWFYNLRVGRNRDQVEREIRAILSTNPAGLGLSEAIGYRLPQIAGYWLIRDTSTPGRANVAAYVRIDLPVRGIKWTPCKETWKRPKHPGRHWAREILSFRMARVSVQIVHQPPRYTDNEIPAQREGIEKLTELMSYETRVAKPTKAARKIAEQRPRLALGDYNRAGTDDGPGPGMLARAIGGKVAPMNRIDCLVYRGQVKVRRFKRPTRVAGVNLKSDHPHALHLRLRIPRRWLTL